tara:strand:+ start:355 stop:948 length:594 start_codon:yes stop_codon:yes gene_type:complete
MKKYLLLLVFILGCDNPLDKVYEPSTFRTDFRAVQEFDSLSSIKIAFVIDYETPALGATYQEILNRFSEIQEELRIEDSILKEELRLKKLELAELTRIRDSINKVTDSINQVNAARTRLYIANRNKQKKILINVLDEWAVPGKYRQVILQEFDETPGILEIGEVKLLDVRRISIDIGPRILYTVPDLIKANKTDLLD